MNNVLAIATRLLSKRHVVLGLGAALLAVNVLVALASYARGPALQRSQIEAGLEERAERAVVSLRGWWRNRRRDVLMIADAHGLLAQARRPASATSSFNKSVAKWQSDVRRAQGYEHFEMLSLSDNRSDPAGANHSLPPETAEAFERLRSSGSMEYTPLFRAANAPTLFVDIMAPVGVASGNAMVESAVLVRLNVGGELRELVRHKNLGQRVLVLACEGTDIVHVNHVLGAAPVVMPLDSSHTESPEVCAVLGQEGILEGTDNRQVHTLSAMKQSGVLDLAVVAMLDEEDVFEPVAIWLRTAALVFFVEVLCLAIIFGYVRGRQAARQSSHLNALEGIGDPVLIVDATGDIVDWNKHALELYGYDADEMPGLTVDSVTSPGSADTAEMLSQAATDEGFRGSVQQVGKDRNVFPASVFARRLAESGTGNVLVAIRNTAEESRVHEALLSFIDRTDQVGAAVGEWTWETDANGRHTYSCKASFDVIGFAPDQVMGRSVWDLAESSYTESQRMMQEIQVREHRPLENVLSEFKRPDGQTVMLETNAVPFFSPNDEFLGYRGVSADVTERERVRRQQDEALANYQRLADSFPGFVFVVDLVGRYRAVNSKLADLFNMTTDDMVDRTLEEYGRAEQATQEYRQLCRELVRSGRVSRKDITMTVRGETRHYEEVLVPVPAPAKGVPLVHGTAIDITERRRAEEAIRTRERRLSGLYSVSQAISESENFEELLRSVLQKTLELVHIRAGMIHLLDDQRKNLTLAVQSGLPDDYIEGVNSIALPTGSEAEEGGSGSSEVLYTRPGDEKRPDSIDRLLSPGFELMVSVPLTAHNLHLGTMNLVSFEAIRVPEEHEQLLQAMGAQIGVAISRALLVRADRERRMQAEALASIAQRLTSVFEYQTMLEVMMEKVTSLVDVDLIAYYGCSDDDHLSFVAATGEDDRASARADGKAWPAPDAAASVLEDGDALVQDAAEADESGQTVLLPLIEGDNRLGLLEVHVADGPALTDQEQQFMNQLRELLIPEVQKTKLYQELQSLNRSLEATNVQRAIQLEQERDRVGAILQSVIDALIVTDLDRRIILANPAANRIFGVAANVEAPEPVDDALSAEIVDVILPSATAETDSAAESDVARDVEVEMTADDGQELVLSARTSTVYGRSGDVLGYVTSFRDMTRLHEIDQMKTDFISTAAHELRTPLTTLRGFSELLMTRKLSGDDTGRFVEYIHQQSLVLGDIIADLLDISRVEAGKGYTVAPEPCDIREVCISEAEVAVQATQNHTVDTSGCEEVSPVLGDRDRLAQVIRNLMSNSIKYAPGGGTIFVTCSEDERWVHAAVRDEGLGMTTEQIDRVFDKFYRVDASNTAVAGTGLGMSIVQKLSRLHGGVAWVESEIGVGTCVHVEIPRTGVVPLALIVESDETKSRLLTEEFERAEWEVNVARTEKECEAAMGKLPSVAVLGLSGPRQVQLLQRFNDDHRTSGLPMVVLVNQEDFVLVRRLCRGRDAEITSPSTTSRGILRRAKTLDQRRRSAVDLTA